MNCPLRTIVFVIFLAGPALSFASEESLDLSQRDVESALEEFDIEIEFKLTPWEGEETLWRGRDDVIIVELFGPQNDLKEVAVTAGFPRDDMATAMKSMLALTGVIVVALPFEERRPVAAWLTDKIEEAADVGDFEEVKETYTKSGRVFTWKFWKILGLGNLSVKPAQEEE